MDGLMALTLAKKYTDSVAPDQGPPGATDLLNAIYPVGAIYMSVADTNPAALFGGTWAAWGQGRVPVGVDAARAEFNAAGRGNAYADGGANPRACPRVHRIACEHRKQQRGPRAPGADRRGFERHQQFRQRRRHGLGVGRRRVREQDPGPLPNGRAEREPYPHSDGGRHRGQYRRRAGA